MNSKRILDNTEELIRTFAMVEKYRSLVKDTEKFMINQEKDISMSEKRNGDCFEADCLYPREFPTAILKNPERAFWLLEEALDDSFVYKD